ncbi:hypothetical protein V2G26_014396 [Clonostachys chloroleuca]
MNSSSMDLLGTELVSQTIRTTTQLTYLDNNTDSQSLTNLSSSEHQSLRHGLIAISVLSAISLTLSSSLFTYLTYKLISWKLNKRERARILVSNVPDVPPVPNLDFQDGPFVADSQTAKIAHEAHIRQIRSVENEAPNQFLILIYNLLLADIHQAIGFFISVVWLSKDGIYIDSPACFVQALFIPNGDLAASCFITLIAIHTYLSVVRQYQPPQRVLNGAIIFMWVFVWGMSAIPILATNNGKVAGGFFVRAGAWCWITRYYENLRLLTHYLFIFIAIIVTSGLYIATYISLRRQMQLKAAMPHVQLNHNPVFLIYPLIYVVCTLPLAVGRVATMASATVPIAYYCFAGAAMVSNGLLDCILFSSTRHSIVFGAADQIGIKDTGLDTFSFMRTPASKFGNNVWIQGGPSGNRSEGWSGVGGWWQARIGRDGSRGTPPRSVSQESLRAGELNDLAIQMNVVTTMTVEVDPERRINRHQSESLSAASDDTTIKRTERQF